MQMHWIHKWSVVSIEKSTEENETRYGFRLVELQDKPFATEAVIAILTMFNPGASGVHGKAMCEHMYQLQQQHSRFFCLGDLIIALQQQVQTGKIEDPKCLKQTLLIIPEAFSKN
jgi:hypothetical protein